METYKKLIFEKSYINGAWKTLSKSKITVTNPAGGSKVGEVFSDDRTLVKEAIDAAKNAFPEWKGKTVKERSII